MASHFRPVTRQRTVYCPCCQKARTLRDEQRWGTFIPLDVLCCGAACLATYQGRLLAAYNTNGFALSPELERFILQSGMLEDDLATALADKEA